MKTLLRYLIPAVGLAAALPALRAADPAPAKGERKEMRVIIGNGPDRGPHTMRPGHPPALVSVTFLGVETRPAGETLGEQLNLPKGVGLVVGGVAPDSPASGVLKVNDVLVKLDDQQLIEQRQLAVLVRNHQAGDEVAVTYVRGGKETTVKVKLAQHDIPKMALGEALAPGGGFGPQLEDGPPFPPLPGMGREDMDRVLELIAPKDAGPRPHRIRIETEAGPGMHTTTVNTSNSNMVFSDEQGSLDLTIKDGKKTLVAKNAKGEPLFSGPVTTPEERKALPPEVRERLDQLEGMQEFKFQIDEDFEVGKGPAGKPGKSKIRLPRGEFAPPAPPQPPVF